VQQLAKIRHLAGTQLIATPATNAFAYTGNFIRWTKRTPEQIKECTSDAPTTPFCSSGSVCLRTRL